GASVSVPPETSGAEYLDLMYRLFLQRFPGDAPLLFAGFSFGGAIATHFAARLGERVTHLCLISPAGFAPRQGPRPPTRSYKDADDDEGLLREICRHNLLVNMLSDAENLSDETLDIQTYCVRHTRFNSRKVSRGGTLLGDLAKRKCRLRVLWGEGDDSVFRRTDDMLSQLRAVVNDLDLHRIPNAGHWAAYENAPVVNRLMQAFFKT
ncbi:MAG: alpha/beta hydrolase, partial [bacterium]|nr:alpha/beta hydrolase [bacterium]